MDRDVLEVRELLSALTAKAQSCKVALDALRNPSDALEMRALLSALTAKVQSCRVALDAQHIGTALHGLKRMNRGVGGAGVAVCSDREGTELQGVPGCTT
jgi:hypothetical protein